jgi:hypothetical protein
LAEGAAVAASASAATATEGSTRERGMGNLRMGFTNLERDVLSP